jgi:hypothetical protein
MRLLLEAEVANAKGRETIAHELFTYSIACAKSSLSLMVEAFGNEPCGELLYNVKRVEAAKSFFEEACRIYESMSMVNCDAFTRSSVADVDRVDVGQVTNSTTVKLIFGEIFAVVVTLPLQPHHMNHHILRVHHMFLS